MHKVIREAALQYIKSRVKLLWEHRDKVREPLRKIFDDFAKDHYDEERFNAAFDSLPDVHIESALVEIDADIAYLRKEHNIVLDIDKEKEN